MEHPLTHPRNNRPQPVRSFVERHMVPIQQIHNLLQPVPELGHRLEAHKFSSEAHLHRLATGLHPAATRLQRLPEHLHPLRKHLQPKETRLQRLEPHLQPLEARLQPVETHHLCIRK